MPNYRAAARKAARRYGLDPAIFTAQIQQESGFNPDAVSSAGATGIAQIMPGTAKGWGVNPRDPIASLDAAAKNMARYVKQYGSYENALRAYNAGPGAIEASKGYAQTNNYVKTILGGRSPSTRGVSPEAGGGGGGGGGIPTTDLSSGGAAGLLGALQTLQQPERPQVSTPAAPSFSARPVLPSGYQAPEASAPARQRPDLNEALAQIAQLSGGNLDVVSGLRGGPQQQGGGQQGEQGGVNLTPRGAFSGTTGPVNQLAKLAGRVAGTQVTSGKRDTVTTASGGVSDHYAGNKTANARDISGSVPQMDRAAVAIAKALGISYRKGQPLVANVNRGGIRYQILYRTNVGGDHFDHVHVGARRL